MKKHFDLPDSGSRFEELIGLGDQSARKSYYRELLELNEQLEQRVMERTRELTELNALLSQEVATRTAAEIAMSEAKEQAEEANRSKDRYLAAASHDLLQPLNAARLLVSALRERPLPDLERHLVEGLHLSLDGAEQLLADLLDISKLDQQAVKADIQVFPLSRLITSMQAEFSSVANERGLSFRIAGNVGRHVIRSDLRLLSRILRNLLSNALRYTDEGGVLLGFRRRGQSLDIQVYDTGCGIPEDQQQEVFREFHQLQSRSRNRGGVGLGLAIVERMAKMLDHPLRLNSRPGRGSCFSIRVPLAHPDERVTYAVDRIVYPQQTDSLQGVRLLVIDNEPSIQTSMRSLLNGWGCEVDIASDLATARDCIEQTEPELILIDYHLDEGWNGLEVLQTLRHEGWQGQALIITADRTLDTRQAFRDADIPALNKPVKPGKLRALISHLLNSAAA
ncbi:ATP-binding response regulator [Nitrincola sp. MINF-07-Sa-05]|uniref:ATP-binding response regulator n=1 Tax=Nitrincola salilacus TaxID=3400273 RepID=UPI003917C898